jgi:protein PhnA
MNDVSGFATALAERADSKCELCGSRDSLIVIEVPPSDAPDADRCVLICETCAGQIASSDSGDASLWRCLGDSMWSDTPAVKVLTWRLLQRFEAQAWAKDLLDQMYLDEATQQWAESISLSDQSAGDEDSGSAPTVDSNGATLISGDSVCIIKDLNVKGTTFTAKRGTIVRNIRLTDNPEHVEGRVNGTVIVLKTCFLKKST